MNSSNDSLDKRLQQRFRQLFADEQAVVDEALKQRIWEQLPSPAPRAYRSAGLLLLGLFLLVGISLYNRSALVTTASKRANGPGQPSAGPHAASHALAKQSRQRGARVNEPVNAYLPAVIPPSDPRLGQLSAGPPKESLNSPATDALPSNQPRKAAPSTAADSRRSRLFINPTQHFATTRSAVRSERFVSSRMTTALNNDSLANEPMPNWVTLPLSRPLNYGSVSSALSTRLNRQVDFLPLVTSVKTASNQSTTAVDWFFTAAPFSTYQRMTIVPKPDTYVQAVASPAAWSAQTWGYRLSGGIRWLGWEAALSYGQLRRWAYYERATDAYQVEPSGPTAYQVTRGREAVRENVSLSLLGVGITRAYTWGKHHRYYARTGAELSCVLPTHQALGWLEASWGLTLPLSKRHQLQFGPTVAYSLSDVWSTDRQLRIRPYTAGLSLTLCP